MNPKTRIACFIDWLSDRDAIPAFLIGVVVGVVITAAIAFASV